MPCLPAARIQLGRVQRRVTLIRGGVGIFSGRPPYVWMSNTLHQHRHASRSPLICTRQRHADIDGGHQRPAAACASGAAPTPPTSRTSSTTEPDLKFQQALKYSIGIDHRLPGRRSWRAWTSSTPRTTARSLPERREPREAAANTEGRAMYGTIAANSSTITSRISTKYFGNIMEHCNKAGAYSALVTAQLHKRFGNGLEFNAAYTYSEGQDYSPHTSSQSPLQRPTSPRSTGTLADRQPPAVRFRHPAQDPSLSTIINVPLGFMMSLIYTGTAGLPYAYVTTQDANADGFAGNDLIYIPQSAGGHLAHQPADFDRLNICSPAGVPRRAARPADGAEQLPEPLDPFRGLPAGQADQRPCGPSRWRSRPTSSICST